MVSKVHPHFALFAWLFTWRGLPLELQIGAFHAFEREAEGAARAHFKRHHAAVKTRQSALPTALVFKRLAQHDLRLLPLKSDVVLRFEQLPLHARRADLERIMARHNVFDIQNGSHLLGYQLTVGVRDALGPVDRDAQKLMAAAAL